MDDTESLVIKDIAERQLMGIKKYGITVAENTLSLRQWLQHAYEESLDKAIYLKRAIQEMSEQDNKNEETVQKTLIQIIDEDTGAKKIVCIHGVPYPYICGECMDKDDPPVCDAPTSGATEACATELPRTASGLPSEGTTRVIRTNHSWVEQVISNKQ